MIIPASGMRIATGCVLCPAAATLVHIEPLASQDEGNLRTALSDYDPGPLATCKLTLCHLEILHAWSEVAWCCTSTPVLQICERELVTMLRICSDMLLMKKAGLTRSCKLIKVVRYVNKQKKMQHSCTCCPTTGHPSSMERTHFMQLLRKRQVHLIYGIAAWWSCKSATRLRLRSMSGWVPGRPRMLHQPAGRRHLPGGRGSLLPMVSLLSSFAQLPA